MNIQQLKKYWDDNGEFLYVYSPFHVDKTKVDNEAYVFLTTCGFPLDTAPFLNFSKIRKDELLTPNQIFKTSSKALENYLVFGFNGSGDPICIDISEPSQIVYLNHDDDFKRVFINSSISQFVVCLTKYRDFIITLVDNTSNGFSRRKFIDSEFEKLKSDFKSIDNDSLSINTFWKAELDNLIWERNND